MDCSKNAEPSKRRSWRKLHVGIDADNGQIVAFDLTARKCATPLLMP